jgi:hypothetical protein
MMSWMVMSTALIAAAPAVAAEPVNDEAQIRAAVVEFARGGDRRDVASLERVLDANFRVVAAMPGKDAALLLSRAEYLGMLASGKIGGGERALTIDSVVITGAVAHAKVKMTRADAIFEAVITLVKRGGGWVLIQDATGMSATRAGPIARE